MVRRKIDQTKRETRKIKIKKKTEQTSLRIKCKK